MSDDTAHLEKKNRELTEFIKYWSYCTRQGMLKYCPEERKELYKKFKEFGVDPYLYDK